MSILNDATLEEMAAAENTENLAADLDMAQGPTQTNQNNFGMPSIDWGFLKSPTGEGGIDDYIDHVLNPERSRGLAQMLRGFTGIAGNLNLAILDIMLGGFAYLKEIRKAPAKQEVKQGVPINEKPIINV